MKEVRAYIKPRMLGKVVQALHELEGLTGLSVSEVRGYGRTRDGMARVVAGEVDQDPHVRLEIFCRDDHAGAVVAAIQENAHTGLRGDGKIYVLPVEEAVRIGTGERGEGAV